MMDWHDGEYVITPYIVRLMKEKQDFVVFYDNGLVLLRDEFYEWQNNHPIVSPDKNIHMNATHLKDRNGRTGYLLKDPRVLRSLTIPDELITDYESLVNEFEKNEVKIADISYKLRKCSLCKNCIREGMYGTETCIDAEMATTEAEEIEAAARCCEFEEWVADEEDEYCPSSTAGDYSPSNPWDAPGMSIKDFI